MFGVGVKNAKPLKCSQDKRRIVELVGKEQLNVHWDLASGRAASGMEHLHPPEHLDRGFKPHSRHGCLFILCSCCALQIATLRRADPPSIRFIVSELR
jgi:hypothetical protein